MTGRRMLSLFLMIAGLAYLATGFYVVRGNTQAVIRRCGRLVTHADGKPRLVSSGLYFDLPWPFSTIDQINIHELRTLTIGLPDLMEEVTGPMLQSPTLPGESQFLTGDKNIVHVQVAVQYRIAETGVTEFLMDNKAPELRLRLLAESVATELIVRSGVDFVHPLGLSELRTRLTRRVRDQAAASALGVDIEDVSIVGVYPPVRVKSYFLDVANARAEKETTLLTAQTYAEDRETSSEAEARGISDESLSRANDVVQLARAEGESFRKLVAQFERAEDEGISTIAESRQMALERRYSEVMSRILKRATGQVIVDGDRPVDLMFWRKSGVPAASEPPQ
ncbi:MAG: SPFH domain-containing protein [Planctomycetaceae bacterium]